MTDEPTDDLSDELRDGFRALIVPGTLHLPPPSALAALGRLRQRRRRAVVASACAAAVVGVVPLLALPSKGAGPDRAGLAAPQLDGMKALACGSWPLSVLAADPGFETAAGPEAAGLRWAINTAPIPIRYPNSSWVLMGRDEAARTVTFGHRTGRVGIADTLTLTQNGDGRYQFASSGGCGTLGYPDGRRATRLSTYETTPGGLTVTWIGGVCGDGSDPATVVDEQDDTVSVTVVPPPNKSGFCPDVGRTERTVVRLAAPLAGRGVVDAGTFPTLPVPTQAEYDAQIADFSARDTAARALCATSAQTLGGKLEVSYAVTVDQVRRRVPQVRTAWADVAGDAPAAHCYLRRPDRTVWAYVTQESKDPLVVDRAYDQDGLYVQLSPAP